MKCVKILGLGNIKIPMVMKFKIFFLLLLLTLTNTLYGMTKEDRRIKASLYPYTIKGITYYPHKVSIGERKEVLASWYGEYFHGRKTALGEVYDMYGHTAAHKTYPLGTVILVSNPKNGKSLKVRINDRGPFWNQRELDLSMGAAEYLETKEQGVATVNIEVISVPKIANSFIPIKKKKPLTPSYNVGYTATSYSDITKVTKQVLIEIGTFSSKKESRKYLRKLKKYLPKAYVVDNEYNFKVKFSMKANEKLVDEKLKKLKKKGLITGYGICWSYE